MEDKEREAMEQLLDNMVNQNLIDTIDLDVISSCIEDDLFEMTQKEFDRKELTNHIRIYLSLVHEIPTSTLEERLIQKAW